MDDRPAQNSARIEALEERGRIATTALFGIKRQLQDAADQWAKTRDGFPVAQSLRTLVDECDREWHRAMAAFSDETEAPKAMDKPMARRVETTYLNIIGGLVALMLGKSPAGKPQSSFENQGAIISTMLGHYGYIKGMGDSNLEKIMAEANKTLKNSTISGG